jgi:hypothetical protein
MTLLIELARWVAVPALRRLAPKLVPILSYVGGTFRVLTKLEDEAAVAAYEHVRKCNGSSGDQIVHLEYTAFGGREALKEVVDKIGGTAWVQESRQGLIGVGGRGRLGRYWHPRKDFKPSGGGNCPLRHVVNGKNHFNNQNYQLDELRHK